MDDFEAPPVAPPEPGSNGSSEQAPELEQWRFDKKGRAFVTRGGGKAGIIMRSGDEETVAQARERDAIPKEDRRPRRKPKTPPKPAASRKVELRTLEEPLAAALKAPGAIAMSFGDEWMFEHFNASGPYLARHLILAAEYNPWLREKLENAASGEEAMVKVMGLMAVSGAVVMYMVPPMIYLLNLPVPDKAREMMNVPPRRTPTDASSPPPDPPGHSTDSPFSTPVAA